LHRVRMCHESSYKKGNSRWGRNGMCRSWRCAPESLGKSRMSYNNRSRSVGLDESLKTTRTTFVELLTRLPRHCTAWHGSKNTAFTSIAIGEGIQMVFYPRGVAIQQLCAVRQYI